MTDQIRTPEPGDEEPTAPTEETEPALEPAAPEGEPQTITITEPTIIVPEQDA